MDGPLTAQRVALAAAAHLGQVIYTAAYLVALQHVLCCFMVNAPDRSWAMRTVAWWEARKARAEARALAVWNTPGPGAVEPSV